MTAGKTAIALFFAFACVARALPAFANDLNISNAVLVSPDQRTSTVKVQFDLSWENSWRSQTNRDAVWVFVKYSTDSGATWAHCTMKTSGTNPSGFAALSGTAVDVIVPADKKGAFVQRSAAGSGPVSLSGLQLVWDYAADGLSASSSARVKVFGIEMVYVPTGSFYAGDGDGSSESVLAFHAADDAAVQITGSSATVTVDSNANDDIDSSPVNVDGDGGVTGNPSWPAGYRAFYLMKYEITEEQYVDFLNTLTRAQQQNRVASALGNTVSNIYVMSGTASQTDRNAVQCPASGNGAGPVVFSTDRPDRACGYLSWMDGCAFADWAGLRPMTELEYEKACRGPATPSSGEFAWGDDAISAADELSGDEDGTEACTTEGANANYGSQSLFGGDGGSGPLRAGIFATSSSSRPQAGAGYYGNMDLSGNLAERCVTLGNSQGRGFSGTSGDGALTGVASYEGNATNADWPGIDASPARGVTGAAGSGTRGGGWNDASDRLSVSERTGAAAASTVRAAGIGFRAARTA